MDVADQTTGVNKVCFVSNGVHGENMNVLHGTLSMAY